MEDDRIHDQIERLVAEEHELWHRDGAGSATDADRSRWSRCSSRSTGAGTYSGSGGRWARPAAIRMPRARASPRSSSGTSSSRP